MLKQRQRALGLNAHTVRAHALYSAIVTKDQWYAVSINSFVWSFFSPPLL